MTSWLYNPTLGRPLDEPMLQPDSLSYLRLPVGAPVPSPHNLRWLPPLLFRHNMAAWSLTSLAACIVFPAIVAYYAMGFGVEPGRAALAGLLTGSMSSLWRRWLLFSVLVDQYAMVAAVLSAGLWLNGWYVAAVVAALVSGACKESAPVFAAAMAMSPWLLLGLLAVPWWRHRSSKWVNSRRPDYRYPWPTYVLPWGAAGVLALVGACMGSPATAAAALVLIPAYAQVVVPRVLDRPNDAARLYLWAAPAVCVVASGAPVALIAMAVMIQMTEGRSWG